MVCLSMKYAPGIMMSSQTTTMVRNMAFWWRGPSAQKSTRMIRMPLSAWYRTAATRPTSRRLTIGVL